MIPVGTRVRIAYVIPGERRFAVGEEGVLLPHDFKKYPYLVELDGLQTLILNGETIHGLRRYYFYENEVEEVK